MYIGIVRIRTPQTGLAMVVPYNMQVRKKFGEYLPYYKRNLKVAFPVMLTQLGASLVGLFDSMMVGHYATVDLAAVSFANALFFAVMVFAMGALMGITPLIGFQVGNSTQEDNTKSQAEHRIASLLQNGISFTILLSILMLIILGGCLPFFNYFGQDPEVIRVARPYYILIVISIVPFLFFCLQKQFLEGLGNTVVAMVITLAMNLLNILLNWVLIFGHWGFPAMGATGAGIATLISRIGMPLCFTAVIVLRREWRHYLQLFSWRLASWSEVVHLAKIGIPIGLQSLTEFFIFAIAFVVVGWISKEALAAQQIANQIADLTFMLAQGIGAATTIRVSHQFGKGDLRAVRMASNASIHLVLMMNTIGAALMISLRNYIPLLFTNDPLVIDIASTLIVFAGLFQYADGLQNVGGAMLRGITDVKIPVLIAFFSYIVVGLSVGITCTFPLRMGASGIWVGFIVGLTLAAILLHTRFNKKYKQICMATA